MIRSHTFPHDRAGCSTKYNKNKTKTRSNIKTCFSRGCPNHQSTKADFQVLKKGSWVITTPSCIKVYLHNPPNHHGKFTALGLEDRSSSEKKEKKGDVTTLLLFSQSISVCVCLVKSVFGKWEKSCVKVCIVPLNRSDMFVWYYSVVPSSFKWWPIPDIVYMLSPCELIPCQDFSEWRIQCTGTETRPLPKVATFCENHCCEK